MSKNLPQGKAHRPKGVHGARESVAEAKCYCHFYLLTYTQNCTPRRAYRIPFVMMLTQLPTVNLSKRTEKQRPLP